MNVDNVKNNIDIVEVISEYTELRPEGKAYKGLCPFHGDKNPSMYVYPDSQSFYCFSCGAGRKDNNGGSDVIGFTMGIEGMTFKEAMIYLAEKHGIDIGKEYSEYPDIRRYRQKIINQQSVYSDALRSSKRAQNYLKSRNITGDEALKYEIGYDKDKDRISIMIRDNQGMPSGFAFRALGDEKNKYINSRDSKIFKKGKVLYGLHECRKVIRESGQKYLVLTEGYFDVISLQRHGIPACAVMSTSLTDGQIDAMKNVTKDVVVMFDGEENGRREERKATLKLMEEGLNVDIVTDLKGKDPDELEDEMGELIKMHIHSNRIRASIHYATKELEKAENDIVKAKSKFRDNMEVILDSLPKGAEKEEVERIYRSIM